MKRGKETIHELFSKFYSIDFTDITVLFPRQSPNQTSHQTLAVCCDRNICRVIRCDDGSARCTDFFNCAHAVSSRDDFALCLFKEIASCLVVNVWHHPHFIYDHSRRYEFLFRFPFINPGLETIMDEK